MREYWRKQCSERQELLERELERITQALRDMGVRRVVLLGSAAR